MDNDLDLSMDDAIAIYTMGYFGILQNTEGVIVHYKGKGLIIVRKDDEIYISQDDDVLKLKDRSLVWVHDEPVGNA